MKIGKLAAIGATLLLAGCGQESKVVPVEGTLTLNGKPLEGAEVAFVPDDKNLAQTAGSDRTGPAGNFKMIHRGRSGLAPGKYRVIVGRGDVAEFGVPDVFMGKLAQSKVQAQPKKGAKKPPAPARYTFDREVYASGGPIDMDIKDKAF